MMSERITNMEIGKKNWVFCDGYLPPHGDNPDFEGHEALMITNLNKEDAEIELTFVFEDRDPIEGIRYKLASMRTTCIRLDQPLGENKIMLGEAVELGQKITKIRASARTGGKDRELFCAKSVGYKLIKCFDTVKTDEITVEILESLDTPVLDKIGAYLIEKREKNEKAHAKIPAKSKKTGEDVVEIELGGIYEFDTIYADWFTEQGYEIYLFNGTDYDLVKAGDVRGFFRVRLDTPSDGAYRLKIVFENDAPDGVDFIVE